MADIVEIPDDFLEKASGSQLAELCKQLGVLTNATIQDGDSLRALVKRQELKT
jgi:hypothetical protein